MIRRTAKILAWTTAGTVAVVGAAGGLFAWRLAQGPIALDPLTPYVERALSDPRGRYRVDIGQLVLSWVDEEESDGLTRLDLRAIDVHAVNADGNELAAVPDFRRLKTTSSAVSSPKPPWNCTPRRRWKVQVRPSALLSQRSARSGSISAGSMGSS